MEALLEEILANCAPYKTIGKPADYIPELAKSDINDLGIYIVSSDGQSYKAGDYRKSFTVQSVIKPVLLLLCLMDNGIDVIREKIGVEATGKPFDAINVSDQPLLSQHLNPMVNMGAIFMCTLIKGNDYTERFSRLLELTRKLANNPDIVIDEEVYLSEKSTGNKNRALAFLLKSYGMLEDDVEEVLDCYFKACSIKVNCRDLANIAFLFANRGRHPILDDHLFPAEYAHYVNAVLVTCGMYDGSGDFAVRVGMPAKSGVGGGIMAVAPTRMGIGIFSPGLDEKGNSLAGIKVLEELSQRMYLSIF
ncbi:MAG: glutaminase A [Clostridiaceae bacterium]|nr:glutaminase A [Clostridiaceae bacterium]